MLIHTHRDNEKSLKLAQARFIKPIHFFLYKSMDFLKCTTEFPRSFLRTFSSFMSQNDCIISMSLAHKSHPTVRPQDGGISICTSPSVSNEELDPTPPELFPISRLPLEIRNEIYAFHLASLPPLLITADNFSSLLHKETQLSRSSSYFISEISPSIFYSNCIFTFSSPKVLRQFAAATGSDRVAKVRIKYGRLSQCHHTDWVFALFQNFKRLEEVTFILQGQENMVGMELFEQWWECVKDAVREAWECRVENKATKRKGGVLLTVESSNLNTCKLVGGY